MGFRMHRICNSGAVVTITPSACLRAGTSRPATTILSDTVTTCRATYYEPCGRLNLATYAIFNKLTSTHPPPFLTHLFNYLWDPAGSIYSYHYEGQFLQGRFQVHNDQISQVPILT